MLWQTESGKFFGNRPQQLVKFGGCFRDTGTTLVLVHVRYEQFISVPLQYCLQSTLYCVL